MKRGFILGFKIERMGGEGMEVLLFTNNTLIFCDANQEQLKHQRTKLAFTQF